MIPKKIKYAKDKGFPCWENMAMWKNFKPPYITKDIWDAYLQYVTS
jgi:hypothetical protein